MPEITNKPDEQDPVGRVVDGDKVFLFFPLWNYLATLQIRLNDAIFGTTLLFPVFSKTKLMPQGSEPAEIPATEFNQGRQVHVTDATAGQGPYYSDGSGNWRRVGTDVVLA
jgi:hypothetical protein